MSLPASLAIVDVETTGANPVSDRITEIAILRVEHGRVVERWSSLVNPGRTIPANIQSLIGITDEMVADAPPFPALAARVREILSDCVFVAHNARFDYGFVKNEFARMEQDFKAEVLCTVKFSRALYPEHHRHGLDALILRHGLTCKARHRALGDAEVLWDFLQKSEAAFEAATIGDATGRAMKMPPRPAGLPEGTLEGIPPTPGVYLFFGDGSGARDLPLYVGRSVNLRSRVGAHFAGEHRNGKDARLAQQIRRVEWIETAGELGAQLVEARLIKERQPLHNRAPNRNDEVTGLRLLANRRKPPIFERVRLSGRDPLDWGENLYGTFRNKREIDNTLREFAHLYRLCPRRLGIESGKDGACSAFQTKRCAGVCAGRESGAAHDARLAGALAALRLKPWSWPGPIGIRESRPDGSRTEIQVVDHWCLLGSVGNETQLAALFSEPPPRQFDVDAYRILSRWLAVEGHRQQVIASPPPA